MKPLLEHIHQIGLHYQEMKRKSDTNSNYKTAVHAAETLLNTSLNAILDVYKRDGDSHSKMCWVKSNCQEAIEKARPVLTKHREWGKVLGAFLLAVLTLPVSLPLYAVGFFTVKTQSDQLLDKLQNAIDLPNFRAS